MEKNEFFSLYHTAFAANGLTDPVRFPADAAEKCRALTERLLETNRLFNLTAIRTERDCVVRHLADIALAADRFPENASVLDVGTGAGFPALPLAVFRPDLKITALDSTAKKVRFVGETAEALGLRNVTAVCERAEEAARMKEYRECFGAVTARAVAPLAVLLEWCAAFVRPRGVFIAMKGAGAAEELSAAGNAAALLSLALREDAAYTVANPFAESEDDRAFSRHLLLYEKTGKTDARYPRKNTQIEKKPLC